MGCLVIGDSISVGTAQEMPACRAAGRVGISSAGWLTRYGWSLSEAADFVVISLGSNDGQRYDAQTFAAIRARVQARRVIWILPHHNPAATARLEALAAKHGDGVVTFRPGPDHVHPRSYPALAAAVRAKL